MEIAEDIGITRFPYEHHGAVQSVDVRLVAVRQPTRQGGSLSRNQARQSALQRRLKRSQDAANPDGGLGGPRQLARSCWRAALATPAALILHRSYWLAR